MEKQLLSLQADIRKLGRILEDIPHLSAKEYRGDLTTLIKDAALRSEYIACRMRHLLYQRGDMRKAEYLPKAAVEQ